MKGDLLDMVTICKVNVHHSNSTDTKARYDFAKETYVYDKLKGNKSTRGKSFVKLPKSPAIMILGISPATNMLSADTFNFGNRIKLLLQGKQARKTYNIFRKEIIAIVDRLLEHNANR